LALLADTGAWFGHGCGARQVCFVFVVVMFWIGIAVGCSVVRVAFDAFELPGS